MYCIYPRLQRPYGQKIEKIHKCEGDQNKQKANFRFMQLVMTRDSCETKNEFGNRNERKKIVFFCVCARVRVDDEPIRMKPW